MNKMTFILVILALAVGAYGGYAYEKAKFVKLTALQHEDMQKQIDAAKMGSNNNAMMMQQSVVMMAKNDKLGSYATAENGMALYTYDKDTKGQSNCVDTCAQNWPPYVVSGTTPATLPDHVGTIKRADGSTQYTWDDMPLYFYIKDKDKEDVYGDGVGGVWHVAK